MDAVGLTRAVTCNRMEGRCGAAKQQLMQKKKKIFKIHSSVTQQNQRDKSGGWNRKLLTDAHQASPPRTA